MKGIELQAHHIFILVAGAFILSFFIIVALKFRASSEARADFQISTNLRGVFTSAAQSSGSALNATLPKRMKYDCGRTCDCGIVTGSKRTRLAESFFAPGEFPTIKAFLFSQPWGLPRSTNFVYLTSPDYYYYIYHNDDQQAKTILKKIPPVIRVQELGPGQSPEYHGEERSVFVYLFTNRKQVSDDFDDFIEVKLASDNAVYYRSKGNGQAVFSPDEAVYLAALFSEDENVLKCNLRKAYARMEQVAEVLHDRIQLLGAKADAECVGYADAQDQAGFIREEARTLKQSEQDSTALGRLGNAQREIQTINDALTNAGCPQVY
tara:strand:+ start:345 stop:1310 length:966 start_codon:yes stop_codon:yes gene_type:complete